MTSKILINAVDPQECRIAKVTNSKLQEFHIETAAKEITRGNIYKGVITRIEPSLQAVFVDYGAERHGFLQKHEIHSDYHQNTTGGDRSISSIVKKGQPLLVQVVKDPIMKKGAMLTSHLSLPGRYIVLMPGNENRGISRKIEDDAERQRLKEIVKGLKMPEGFGVIVRTAGAKCTKTLINKDLSYLMRLWKTIKGNVMSVEAPSLLYKERDLVVRSLRDYFTPDIAEILVDDPGVLRLTKEFIQAIAPKQTKIVKLHKGGKPIFTKFQLEKQIQSIFESRVDLKSGGCIVIEETEALVSIDVNSGKATQGRNIEQTALRTNLEAAEEIARQLRLRDLGGLIVLDFIDMRDAKNKSEVEKTLKTHVKSDKAKTKVGRISRFGLVEMSRQRIRPSIRYGSHESCPHCQGRGTVPSTETLGIAFLRKLSLETLKDKVVGVKATLPPKVADYILNQRRKDLFELESKHHLAITIDSDDELVPGQSSVQCETKAEPAKSRSGKGPVEG
jgi:ribonuclease E